MSFYLMHRGWMDNDIFEGQPYGERDAWAYLIEHAGYNPSHLRHHFKMVQVGRGQVPTSFRKLADKWKWSVNRVRRFLDLLENQEMIFQKTDTGFLIVNICNYDKYQVAPKETDTQPDTVSDTHSDTRSDTNIKKDKEDNKVKEKKVSISPKPKIDFDFTLMDWKNIDDVLLQKWQEAYPAINIENHLKEAGVWLVANPKNRKSNYARFLNNWFSRQQDKSGRPNVPQTFKSFQQTAKEKTELAMQEVLRRANPS